MIVVAETSPLNYLILIDEITALEKLYERIAVPTAVQQELLGAKTPAKVRDWISRMPSWIELHSVSASPDPSLRALGDGEREAILLAEELCVKRLIIDERHGRRVAADRGFLVTGTIGVLQEGARLGILDLANAVRRLQQTNFFIPPAALARLLGKNP